MKTLVLNKMLSLVLLISGGIAAHGQNSQSQVPGDNFSLEGALELFKKSASPEEFEQLLNSEDSKVNNLDLNGDGYIDYIRVIDRNEGNVHAFILQAVISENESQDVAVIELEKQANGKAVLQITGDADVYGMETIIEPTTEVRVNAGTTTSRTVVNVWAWPSVQYIYSPYYSSVWISPWRWSMRPVWWRPWRPVAYYVYDPWWQPYRPYYSSCYTHRVVYAHHLYQPYRTTSVVVYNRHHAQIEHYRSTSSNHHGDGERDRYDGNRTRYSDGHSNGRQGNNSYHGDTKGRTRSTTYSHNGNTRLAETNRGQNQQRESVNREKSTDRSDFPSRNKFSSDSRNMPNVKQRQSSDFSRKDYSNRKSSVSDFSGDTRQQVSTLRVDTRGSQRSPSSQISRSSNQVNRSSSQVNRSRSFDSPGQQRSGNSDGGNKSGGRSRGKH
jgi:hypothetical protein